MFSINYFQSVTEKFDLYQWLDEPKFNIFNEIDIIINRFWSHPSIVELKQKLSLKRNFALNRLQKNLLKTSLTMYLGIKQLVGIYHLSS